MSQVPENGTIVLLSRRNSGKSFLCKSLLYDLLKNSKKNTPECFIFSQTERVSKSFSCFDDKHIFDKYDVSAIQKIIAQQKADVKKCGREKARKVVIIFDDIIGSVRQDDSVLNSLFTLSRHLNICIFLLVQFAKKVFSPTLRANCDLLLFNRVNEDGLRVVYDSTHFPGTYKEFVHFVREKQADHPYRFIAYNSVSRSDETRWQVCEASGNTPNFVISHKKE